MTKKKNDEGSLIHSRAPDAHRELNNSPLGSAFSTIEALVLFSRVGEKKFNLRRSCNIELTNGIGGCVTFIACVDVGVFAFLGFALLA